jgi:hypothetical protein
VLSFTHLVVARHFFTGLQKSQSNFELDKQAFLYGNVLPDEKRHLFNIHYWDESKSDVEHYLAKAKDRQRSDIERSKALGVVCHFMCDYFCKYHTLQPYRQITDWRHFMYEAMLHIRLVTLMVKRRLIRLQPSEEAIFTGIGLNHLVQKTGELDPLMNAYLMQNESIVTDLSFQFEAVRVVLLSTLDTKFVGLKGLDSSDWNVGDSLLSAYYVKESQHEY